MRTHRGINLSSVAGEGLTGLPGVLITVFFVFFGTCVVLSLFVPDFLEGDSGWLVPIFLLAVAGACGAFVLSQRHDSRLTAQLEQELHKLNETEGQGAVATTLGDVDERALAARGRGLGLKEFPADELRSVARADSYSPEGLLIVVILLFFLWGMVTVLTPMAHQGALPGGFVAMVVGAVIGYIYNRRRTHREARRVARDLERGNGWGSGSDGADEVHRGV